VTKAPSATPGVPGRIFHLALASEWAAAQRSGSYTTSTLGRTLAQEGFIHASRADQWQGVRQRFYADVAEPLVLLVIDTSRLGVPVVAEPAPDSTETFPHIYGPLPVSAVVQALPIDGEGQAGSGGSFSRVFLVEMLGNALLGLGLIVLLTVGVLLGKAAGPDWAVWAGFLAALAVGVPLAVWAYRRRQ
jgi:uncharacterized protein (DUF952 family)